MTMYAGVCGDSFSATDSFTRSSRRRPWEEDKSNFNVVDRRHRLDMQGIIKPTTARRDSGGDSRARYQPNPRPSRCYCLLRPHCVLTVFSVFIGICLLRIDSIMYRHVAEHHQRQDIIGLESFAPSSTTSSRERVKENLSRIGQQHPTEVQKDQNQGEHHDTVLDVIPTWRRRRKGTSHLTPRNGFMIRGSLRTDKLLDSTSGSMLVTPQSSSTTTTGRTRNRKKKAMPYRRQKQPSGSSKSTQQQDSPSATITDINNSDGIDIHTTNEYSAEGSDDQTKQFPSIVKHRPSSRIVYLDDNYESLSTPLHQVTTPVMERRKVDALSSTFVDFDGDDDVFGSQILPFERPFLEECEPAIRPSVPKPHPTCNTMHEMPIVTFDDSLIELLSTRGSWRTAWKIDYFDKSRKLTNEILNATTTTKENVTTVALSTSMTTNATAEHHGYHSSVVMKLLHFSREFDVQSYEAHATDVIVMDLLTKSPYVVNAYGFCGQSVLTDYAPISGRDHVKSYDVRNRERLRIARDLARGLVDIQSLQAIPWNHIDEQLLEMQQRQLMDLVSQNQTREQFEQSSSEQFELLLNEQFANRYPTVFAHNDINIANTVYVDGKVKWNDFNIGVFLRKPLGSNSNGVNATNSSCPSVKFSIPDSNETFSTLDAMNTMVPTDLCPSPVKYRGDLWRSPEEVRNTSYVHLQMSDMYGFANILYQTMSRHQPWTHKEATALTISEIAERKRLGRVPVIPEQYRNATQRDLQSLYVATLGSYHPNPSERPIASRMALSLSTLYNRLQSKTKRLTRGMILDFFVPNRPSHDR